MEQSWHDEKAMSDVTLDEFEKLADRVFELKTQIDMLEAQKKALKQELDAKNNKVMAYLEAFEKDKFVAKGGTLSMAVEKFPAMPKDPQKKKAFMDYLKEKGVYEDLVTVNAQTLRGFYKAEESEHGDDPSFSIPGLEPFERKTIRIRRSKTK